MEDFASILVRDYGLKPQGKSAPMSSTKVSPVVGSSSRGSGYGSGERKGLSGRMTGNASTFGQEDGPHLSRKNGNSRGSGRSPFGGGGGEDIFSAGNYDDVFGGPPKSSTSGPRYDDVFGDGPEPARGPVFDDLFGGLNESKGKTSPSGLSPRGSPRRSDRSHFASEPAVFDELLPGFSSEPVKSRSSGDAKISHEGDPFVPLMDDPLPSASSNSSSSAPFIDPLDVFTVPSVAPIKTTNGPRVSNNASAAFDGFDIFEGFSEQSSVDASKPRESSQSSRDDLRKSVEDFNHSNSNGSREQSPTEEIEPLEKDLPTVNTSEAYHISAKSSPFFSFKSDDGIETAAASVSSTKPGDDGQAGLFSSSLDSPVPYKTRSRSSPFAADVERWLTVNDIKLVTKPSSVPPPSRPPPLPGSGRYGSGSRPRVDSRVESVAQDDRSVSSSWPSANATSSEEEQTGGGTPGGSRKDFFGRADYKSNLANNAGDGEKDVDEDSVGVKDRERERQEKEDTRIAREKEKEKEIKEAEAREEKERERHRRYKEKEREREKDRAAVQRVTLEARERAAHEARERAQRSAVERATAEARERAAASARARSEREKAAVEKANAEARERAEQRAAVERVAQERAGERAAVERAAAEARERAAQEARERAERAAAERAAQEARERAERAATDRVAQEARERAERAAAERAAAARERSQQQRKSENDLESFFGRASTPPSTVERQRPASMNNHNDLNEARRSTMNTSRPSTTASNDDWMSLINPTHSNDDSREHDGETPERRKARTGSQQRSSDRAARAVAEIKQRELNNQREQLEKQRAADQLDSEIKRWAAGKEGNLRALLSTLQYVLWPECGWAPVSLSDLITAAHVKKTYRKATLFVHPDKVQQKGATVQQKYIAEKVFDLLKEAWNKFNSEELF